MKLKLAKNWLLSRQRPYHVENTSSRPITEVKQRWARLVLGWETAWEPLVQLSFFVNFSSRAPIFHGRNVLIILILFETGKL